MGHSLFSVGQFCDSYLEVAFRRDTCFVRNLEGVDLLKGNSTTNLYIINIHEMASTSPICLIAYATSTNYPKNDREDIGKLGAKGDIGFFIGYSANSCTYRVYNQRTRKIIETMNVTFDELSAMAFEQRSLKPGLQGMTMYDDYIGGQPSAALRTTPAALAPQVLQTPTASTTTTDNAPTPTNSSSQIANIPNTS
ncbi:hypothetical protein Tco_0971449 [Tanacetum coccineum]